MRMLGVFRLVAARPPLTRCTFWASDLPFFLLLPTSRLTRRRVEIILGLVWPYSLLSRPPPHFLLSLPFSLASNPSWQSHGVPSRWPTAPTHYDASFRVLRFGRLPVPCVSIYYSQCWRFSATRGFKNPTSSLIQIGTGNLVVEVKKRASGGKNSKVPSRLGELASRPTTRRPGPL